MTLPPDEDSRFREECAIQSFYEHVSQIITGADVLERRLATLQRLNRLNEWWFMTNRDRLKLARQGDMRVDAKDLYSMVNAAQVYLDTMEELDKALTPMLQALQRDFDHSHPFFQRIVKKWDEDR